MDALELLIGDHNRVKGLFAQFNEAHEAGDEATQKTVAQRIFVELDVHTKVEELVFYPVVQDLTGEIHDLVIEGLEEHRVAKGLIAEAKALDPSDEHWAAKVKVLTESVEHHVEEEESEMFPKIRTALGADRRDELGRSMDRKKGELGAPTISATIDLTKSELEELAKEQQIPGRSKMSHDELAVSVAPK
jgi:hemerythrin-like domain-containing protein